MMTLNVNGFVAFSISRRPRTVSIGACTHHHRRFSSTSIQRNMSTVGGGSDDNNKYGGDDDDNEYDPLREWITPPSSDDKNDPDGVVRRSREEARAESRLPVSFGAAYATSNDENGDSSSSKDFGSMISGNPPDIQLQQTGGGSGSQKQQNNNNSASSLSSPSRPNPYLPLITRLTPSDLISRFTSTAPPRVQDAVRTTILGLVGGLASHMKFDTRAIATGERLANLMFQLQMTGYMFKNAEYRLGLSQSLAAGAADSGGVSSRTMQLGGDVGKGGDDAAMVREGRLMDGKIKVRYGGVSGSGDEEESNNNGINDNSSSITAATSSTKKGGLEVEVDAKAYMSELRRDVKRLRDELELSQQAREEELQKDLLAYIRTLPKGELQHLTGTMSTEVLDAMKGLVTAVLSGIGEEADEKEGDDVDNNDHNEGNDVGGDKIIRPDTVTEQSGEALAQLCMWQLVVGYNLRELEVREGFRVSMDREANEKSNGGGSDGRNEWR